MFVRVSKLSTSFSLIKHFRHQLLSSPLSETIKKIHRSIKSHFSQKVKRLQAKLSGTGISDSAFLRSLKSPFSESWDIFLKHISSGCEPLFFFDSESREEICTMVNDLCPDHKTDTITAADQLCEHVFDLLGSGPTFLGKRIDWHCDFKTGHKFNPQAYYKDVQYAPYLGGFDIKAPWELSRSQHFVRLGQAYWFTGDEKYAREFVSQVTDWIKHNPAQYGINWTCTMDVSIRTVNWIWGYFFFRNSLSLTDSFLKKLFKSLLIHGHHIRNNLEWGEALTSNHYLSNVVGLLYLGILFPEFNESQEWQEFGLRELENEMYKQVYQDGVDFEASVTYHRMVAEFFLSSTLLARLNGHIFSNSFMERLEKMVEFVMHLTKPDGTVPIVGDNDNGRLHRLKEFKESSREWIDHRYLLAIGAVLFKREDFAQAANNEWEEAIWMFGKQAYLFKKSIDSMNLPPLELGSSFFKDSGFYIIRNTDWYMNINACPNGQKGNAGHAHNDSLSFELNGKGATWIMDPGTYVYTSDYDARNLFRSTLAHNTVTVDYEEQNRVDPMILFSMKDDARPTVLKWKETDAYNLFIGAHNGYTRLEKPVTHQRAVFFDKSRDVWLIQDTFTGITDHKYVFTLQFAPELKVEPINGPVRGVFVTDTKSQKLHVVNCDNNTAELKVSEETVAPGYGLKLNAWRASFHWDIIPKFTLALTIGTGENTVNERINNSIRHMETILSR